jgi:4-hydroxybenzoyl-CoA thioesterase
MTFTVPQKMLFKHCDPAGIVFFQRYFEMMNDCVEAFCDHIGHPFETLHKDGGVPTGKIESRFYAPSRRHISHSAFEFTIETTCASLPRMGYAATLVFIDAQGKSTPWTDPMRAALTPYINNEA